jgi:GDPmannose 4,6-dehydratase
MIKTALVTGFPGQDACYLADFLLEKGYNVVGGIKRYSAPNYTNLDFLGLREQENFKLEILDVTDIGSIFDVLELYDFDEVYNLAAQSFVGASWRLTHTTMAVDGLGPVNFMEAIRRTKPSIRYYQASTSEMFGNSSTNGVQTEDTPLLTASPYGAAKLYAHRMVGNARDSFGMFACSGILFNHESPIRGIEFVTRKVTDGVAQIITGKADVIKLGNLDAERDWGHARDYVQAQWLMLQQDEPEDFIIATGKKHTIRDLCRVAFNAAGIVDWEKYVVSDPAFVRPHDLVSLHASCDKATRKLGWEPKTSFKEMIQEMVNTDLRRYGSTPFHLEDTKARLRAEAVHPHNDGWTRKASRERLAELEKIA